jgi:hypothetical protein
LGVVMVAGLDVVPVAPRAAALHDPDLHGLEEAGKDDAEPPQNLRQSPGAVWSR